MFAIVANQAAPNACGLAEAMLDVVERAQPYLAKSGCTTPQARPAERCKGSCLRRHWPGQVR